MESVLYTDKNLINAIMKFDLFNSMNIWINFNSDDEKKQMYSFTLVRNLKP